MKKKSLRVGEKLRKSSKELSKPLSVAVCAMLLSVSLVLSYFGNISITFLGTNLIKLTFNIIPIALAAMLYGPVAAGIIGGLSDIIGFMIAPMGAYIPGFTISMILVGVIYGIGLYDEEISLLRLAVTALIVGAAISTVLGTLWFVIFYGMNLPHALFIRGIKELIMYPITVALLFGILKAVKRIPEFKKLQGKVGQ